MVKAMPPLTLKAVGDDKGPDHPETLTLPLADALNGSRAPDRRETVISYGVPCSAEFSMFIRLDGDEDPGAFDEGSWYDLGCGAFVVTRPDGTVGGIEIHDINCLSVVTTRILQSSEFPDLGS